MGWGRGGRFHAGFGVLGRVGLGVGVVLGWWRLGVCLRGAGCCGGCSDA